MFIVYRAVYYLAPLSIALVGLVADELRQRREQAARVGAAIGELTEELMPQRRRDDSRGCHVCSRSA